MKSRIQAEELMLVAARLCIEPTNLKWHEKAFQAVDDLLSLGVAEPELISFYLDQHDEGFSQTLPVRFVEIVSSMCNVSLALHDPDLARTEIAKLYINRLLKEEDPYPTFACWSNEPSHIRTYEDPINQLLIEYGWEYDSQTYPNNPYAEPERKAQTDQRIRDACERLLTHLSH